jgi:thiamine pyrophosphate-dependent acetolactate synthase large subunit-like protein
VAVERYNIKGVGGQFSEVAQALGAYSEKISDPQEIVPSIRRALEINRNGQTVLLEFITKEEGAYSKF